MTTQTPNRKRRVMAEVYRASLGISVIALAIVAVLEVGMLIYSTIDIPLFGPYLWTYRMFYIALLTVAVVCIVLNLLVKKDIERRCVWLSVANPLCAIFFFVWAFGITYFDASKYATVDPTVFVTFSLVVPLGFYLTPFVYAIIVIIADVLMLLLTVSVAGSVAPLSASYGCAAHAEFPDKRITELARTADDRMYAAKAAYYRTSGRERRRFRAEAPV